MGSKSLKDGDGQREKVGNQRYRASGTWEMGTQKRDKQTRHEFCTEHEK